MEAGDKFVYFTKYGGVVKGEVRSVGYVTVVSPCHGVNYQRMVVTSTNGIPYDFESGCGPFKLVREYEPVAKDAVNAFFEGIANDKRILKDRLGEYIIDYNRLK